MFALDSDTASLALSLVVLGAGVLLFGLARPDQAIVRIMAIVIVVVLAWRYMIWRLSDTIPAFDGSPDAIAGWLFAMLEAATLVSSTLALFILSRTSGPQSRGGSTPEVVASGRTAAGRSPDRDL